MTTEEAIKKAELTNEGYEVIGGVEYEKAFCFNMVPKGADSGFANGCTYVVYKDTDKVGWEPVKGFDQTEAIYGKPVRYVEEA